MESNSTSPIQLSFKDFMTACIKACLSNTKERLHRACDDGDIYDYEEEEHVTLQCEESLEFINDIW